MVPGLIFDIKKYAINDGPGIRLTVFFKGCPLACEWCHNPESISTKVQKMYSKSKCIGAAECIDVCPNEALTLTEDGLQTDFSICEMCGKCADVCPSKAIEMIGAFKPLEALMKEIEKETIFFDQSGGGVTFSGGEPLMHADYLLPLLKACGEKDIHRVVDTSALGNREVLWEVAKHTELFLIDLKVMDRDTHFKYTGVSNVKILENIRMLAELDADITFRIPVIKGVNADISNIRETAEFINTLQGDGYKVNLLPYHNIAIGKFEKLGQAIKENNFAPPTSEELDQMIALFGTYGIEASEGG